VETIYSGIKSLVAAGESATTSMEAVKNENNARLILNKITLDARGDFIFLKYLTMGISEIIHLKKHRPHRENGFWSDAELMMKNRIPH
jgi:hypothetical protein